MYFAVTEALVPHNVTLSQKFDSHANANTRETVVATTTAAASTAETESTTNCEPNEMNSIDYHTIPSCSDKQRRSLADANDQKQLLFQTTSTQTVILISLYKDLPNETYIICKSTVIERYCVDV